jgi:hypothetical protein
MFSYIFQPILGAIAHNVRLYATVCRPACFVPGFLLRERYRHTCFLSFSIIFLQFLFGAKLQ